MLQKALTLEAKENPEYSEVKLYSLNPKAITSF